SAFKQRDIAIYELERARNHQYFSFVDTETQAKVLALLSKVHRSKGNKEAAEQFFNAAMAIDPVTAEANSK
ncbi:MAG: hypothetical protein LBF83_06600, partial [Spirochaetaceae bacterium]|nr:hypothetical protein [Spirochaetaceae bacterium]